MKPWANGAAGPGIVVSSVHLLVLAGASPWAGIGSRGVVFLAPPDGAGSRLATPPAGPIDLVNGISARSSKIKGRDTRPAGEDRTRTGPGSHRGSRHCCNRPGIGREGSVRTPLRAGLARWGARLPPGQRGRVQDDCDRRPPAPQGGRSPCLRPIRSRPQGMAPCGGGGPGLRHCPDVQGREGGSRKFRGGYPGRLTVMKWRCGSAFSDQFLI